MTDYKDVQDEELEALRAIFEVSLDMRLMKMGRVTVPMIGACRPYVTELAGPSQTFRPDHNVRCGMTSNPASPMATRSGPEHQNRRCRAREPLLHAYANFLAPVNARSSARADCQRPSSPGETCRTGTRVGRARFRILHADLYPAPATHFPFTPASWML